MKPLTEDLGSFSSDISNLSLVDFNSPHINSQHLSVVQRKRSREEYKPELRLIVIEKVNYQQGMNRAQIHLKQRSSGRPARKSQLLCIISMKTGS